MNSELKPKLLRIARATRPYRFALLAIIAGLIVTRWLMLPNVVVIEREHAELDGGTWIQSTFNTQRLTIDTNGDPAPFNTLRGANSDGFNLWIGGGGANTVGALGNTNLGAENVSIGHFAARDATTMFDSVIIGNAAGRGMTTAADNTVVGRSAMQGDGVNPVTGHHNTVVGVNAMGAQATTAEDSVAVGLDSLEAVTTGFQNTCVGYESCAKNDTGFSNTVMGSHSFENATGAHDNVAIGLNSLRDCTTCDHNTVIGRGTGGGITTGESNTILGGQVTGLAGGLTSNVILADGDGNIRMQIDGTGATTFNGNVTIVGQVAPNSYNCNATTSPAAFIAGANGDVAFATTTNCIYRVTADAANSTITGISTHSTGTFGLLCNVAAAGTLTLLNDTASPGTDGFLLKGGIDRILVSNECIQIVYVPTNLRWMVIN